MYRIFMSRELRCRSVGLYEFGQDPATRARVDERDHMSAKTAAGLVVDQLSAARAQLCEGCGEILDLERDVVQARSTSLQELGDSALGVDGLDQFDVAGAGAEADCLDPLVVQPLAHLDGHSVPIRVDRKGRIDVRNRVRDVVDSVQTHVPSLASTVLLCGE